MLRSNLSGVSRKIPRTAMIARDPCRLPHPSGTSQTPRVLPQHRPFGSAPASSSRCSSAQRRHRLRSCVASLVPSSSSSPSGFGPLPAVGRWTSPSTAHAAAAAPGGQRQQQQQARSSSGGSPTQPADENKPPSEFVWPDGDRRPRVCILGGGFGGLYTALRLDSLLWTPEKRPQVVLVDKLDRFVFKPLLYEIISKEVAVWEIAPHFRDLLRSTSVRFLNDSVSSVDPTDSPAAAAAAAAAAVAAASEGGSGGVVTLGSGTQLEYDWLVLALGAEPYRSFVPGAEQYAMPFASLDDAMALDARLVELERATFLDGPQRKIRVVVVGAGYSGVELACTVAERLGGRGEVQIVDPAPTICPSAPQPNRDAALKVLQEKGVVLRLQTKATSLAPGSPPSSSSSSSTSSSSDSSSPSSVLVTLDDNANNQTVTEADIVLWTVGNRPIVPGPPPPPSPSSSSRDGEELSSPSSPLPFPLSGRGQATVEESLRVVGHPRVFALGDAAACGVGDDGRLLPSTAQVVFQQADYVGWNIWASINRRPLVPFRYQNLGEMMTLGTDNGAVSLGFIDGFFIGGRLAHTARKLAYLYRLPTLGHQAQVGASWLTRAAVDVVAEVQSAITRTLFPTPK